uniref:Uncharacterized protein n=1 Tax=Romanomermis culicivorax TaxID=13658 RepID=A0A915J6G4_ROMCU
METHLNNVPIKVPVAKFPPAKLMFKKRFENLSTKIVARKPSDRNESANNIRKLILLSKESRIPIDGESLVSTTICLISSTFSFPSFGDAMSLGVHKTFTQKSDWRIRTPLF